MDAKTAIELLIKRDKSGNSEIRIINCKSLNDIADFIQQQDTEIECLKSHIADFEDLGRVAIKQVEWFVDGFKDAPKEHTGCRGIFNGDICRSTACVFREFCKLRAERRQRV